MIMTTTTIDQTFEAQAARTPDAVALWFDDRATSYADLDAAAERIAAGLRRLGARPGTLVGVHLERDVDQVATVLGVLKSGAGFMMLDPSFPPARLRTQLAETRPIAVVSSAALPIDLGDLPSEPLRVEDCATIDPTGAAQSSEPPVRARADDLACVMFTSGSTGRPKAVAGNHRSLLVSVASEEFGRVGPGEAIVSSAPVSWDGYLLELFAALLFGGAVVLQPGPGPDPARLARLVARHRVTTLFASASLLPYLVDEHPETFAGLDRVLTGGDVASCVHAARLLARHPRLRLVNGYGPVETMIAATVHEVTPADTAGPSVPIGHDTPGKQVEVLDAGLRPVPPGETGELYISGDGLADGYLGQPGTTAARFVARPGGAPGERMYRTGDLGRRRADGELEYLGRHDAQVKLRGFRLELGEIETALARHPAVSRAAAAVHETPTGQHLVGYVVPAAGAAPEPADVRAHLAATLPRHAVPGLVVVLAELPLTHNGKLDRRALPGPTDLTTASLAAAGRSPATEEERVLAEEFANILGLPEVGVEADFFALGGHSLLAARLVNRVRSRLGAEIDLRDVFAAPSAAALARRLAATTSPSRPQLTAGPRPEVLPLSAGQRRMWFGYADREAGAGYHVARRYELRGPLHPAALRAALDAVVGRHEALRTVYQVIDGRPHQRVLDPELARVGLPLVDLDESRLGESVEEIARRRFDLATDLPLRAALFRLGPEHHVLALVLHHIACDGWSMAPLLADLATAYAALVRGDDSRLPPLPVNYADYALWQQRTAPWAAPALSFWTAALAGLPAESGLPPARPRALAGRRAGVVPVIIGPDLRQAVAAFAYDCRATTFMVIHAALALLLARLGAGTDLAIGTPVAGRKDEALDEVVGFFVNTIVLRGDTSGNPTVRHLLTRFRDADLAAFAHDDLGFERVVEAVNPERHPGRNPLFQVMLALRDEEPSLRLPGVSATTRPVPTGVAQFDLIVDLVQRRDEAGEPAGIVGEVEFAAELFDAADIGALAERLPRLLRAMVAEPDRHVDALDVLSAAERRRLTRDWQGPRRANTATNLPELVAAQVSARPDALAVVAGGQRLTYADLDRRAEDLGAALAEAGVGRDRVVAVVLPRSADLIVALLAVAKAGGAFLVVDPTEPDPRTATMLAEAAPVCAVVGTGSNHDDLPNDLPRIPVAGHRPRPTRGARRPDPDDAAYVIFTSGSTGTPKGVVVSHEAIVNCLLANRGWDPLAPGDRVLFKAAVTFDVAVREVFWPLAQGATIVVAPPGEHRDPGRIAELIARESITTVDFVPSMLPAFLDLRPACPTLRRITCGGEALPPALARRCHRQLGIAVQNFYGPTEAAVEVTWWRWRPDQRDEAAVPLGRPGVNTSVLVLDDRMRPAPIGVVGDIYLAGPQLARGYLGRPGLTAERFVAHPDGSPGERLYRTGDRGRWRPDGVVEFAGRDDGQLKVNGLRVELGEIETALRTHPAVSDGVVVATAHGPGDVRLIAYAVGAPGRGVTAAQLRRHLADRLPRALVPAVLIIDALPLTRHGKLDRAALPVAGGPTGRDPAGRDPAGRDPAGAGRAPKTPRERALCELFAKVLGATAVYADDSFFDLGGHSLLATRLIAQARTTLGVDIDMATLFEHPTASGLAAHLPDSPSSRPTLRPRPNPISAQPTPMKESR